MTAPNHQPSASAAMSASSALSSGTGSPADDVHDATAAAAAAAKRRDDVEAASKLLEEAAAKAKADNDARNDALQKDADLLKVATTAQDRVRATAEALRHERDAAADLDRQATKVRAWLNPRQDADDIEDHHDHPSDFQAATVANLYAQAVAIQNIRALVPVVLELQSRTTTSGATTSSSTSAATRWPTMCQQSGLGTHGVPHLFMALQQHLARTDGAASRPALHAWGLNNNFSIIVRPVPCT